MAEQLGGSGSGSGSGGRKGIGRKMERLPIPGYVNAVVDELVAFPFDELRYLE